ncbi:helix-turn-helix domain-containing protein [Edaphobacter sp.]|uniref:helix-turn-helix domain-containing protein n=1 Tax=Edaphobacter sp. TaxID=1934404 RepID=UPI0032C249B1
MATAEREILTLSEVAGYLKVAERTIYRLAGARKIPAFKVGGAWRFPRAEIDEWIKQQTKAASGSHKPPGVRRR